MFSSIPQKLTSQFGLLPDEKKLAFRSQPGGLSKLATVRNIPESDSYWDQYVSLFDSASEVFSLITPNDIRRALLDAPENIATLIRVITSRLFNLVSDHTFPSASNTSVTALASSFIKAAGSADRNTTKEVLNCLRVLQRVLPVVFEVDGEASVFELEVLWKRQQVDEGLDEGTPQFVIEDEDDSEDEAGTAPPKQTKTMPSLGEKLFSCIIDLLFCCGFTLPTKIQVDHHKINYVIWEKGVGSTTDPGVSNQYDSNKTEVLRLLLVLLSRQIYVPSSSLFSKPSLYTLHLVQKTPRRDVLTILCSLLNTAMNSAQHSVPTAKTNSFRYFLMKLHRTQDFTFILDWHTRVNNLLPGARKSIPYVAEIVLFLWKMIELNKATDLIAHLLCYNLEIKDKPQQHGLCRTLSYIIQTLSAEPAFGNRLASPIRIQVPAKWSMSGTAADFMINAIYSVVATTSGSLNSLYPALIITLSNLAPYFKNLSVTSSARLIQLFTSFSNPLFLLADEGHPRLLFFMLEVFNSVILHHLAENPNLIYGIISSHKTFEDLGTFTLSRGLREIRRVQLAKEEQNRKTTARNPRESAEGPESRTEKARLLSSESQDQLEEVADHDAETSLKSIPTAATADPASSVSEKARGKMKERRSLSSDTTISLERVAASGIGRNGFIPTHDWVYPVMLVISELLPKKANSTSAVLDFLGSVTLKDVLPPVPPLTPRKFLVSLITVHKQWSDASIVWLTSLIWGEIYVRGMTPLGVWNSTSVRLFYVKHSQIQQRQITGTVSSVVGGFLGRTNSDTSIASRQR
ncbi:high-temperature-induced dauer-formation protein-domain-containing protein [Desarmillaria tabescens]|uniref:High-temperature-induced dauer-formation protein-domain-containing protein n=1 Tax=Armillaria tabescens TaxID=1929756 RepID=A0AA39N6B3_ARMTA|nr:high-temperature-induced dauer-formation protein-domain-containing protein [Desarmillaria tabescens]KAK0459482.1 high-temperature-induced dauer-formation protein-domain-containing protein [Desarmillaria tabescens]